MQGTIQHKVDKLVSQKIFCIWHANRCTLFHLLQEAHQSEGELLKSVSLLLPSDKESLLHSNVRL